MTSTPPRAIVWLEPRWQPFVEQVLAAAGDAIQIVGIGSPRAESLKQLAEDHAAEVHDDLRHMIAQSEARTLLVAAAATGNEQAYEDAARAGVAIAALDPSVLRARPTRSKKLRTPIGAFVPSMAAGDDWPRPAVTREHIGPWQALRIESLGLQLPLMARLYDAMATLLAVADVPESIDASLLGPLAKVPDDPAELTGHLLAHVRLKGPAAALVQASDHSPTRRRSLVALAEQGELRVDAQGWQMLDQRGEMLDQQEAPNAAQNPAQRAAAQWLALIEAPASHRIDPGPVLACCDAALLSARTREPESPQRLLTMQQSV